MRLTLGICRFPCCSSRVISNPHVVPGMEDGRPEAEAMPIVSAPGSWYSKNRDAIVVVALSPPPEAPAMILGARRCCARAFGARLSPCSCASAHGGGHHNGQRQGRKSEWAAVDRGASAGRVKRRAGAPGLADRSRTGKARLPPMTEREGETPSARVAGARHGYAGSRGRGARSTARGGRGGMSLFGRSHEFPCRIDVTHGAETRQRSRRPRANPSTQPAASAHAGQGGRKFPTRGQGRLTSARSTNNSDPPIGVYEYRTLVTPSYRSTHPRSLPSTHDALGEGGRRRFVRQGPAKTRCCLPELPRTSFCSWYYPGAPHVRRVRAVFLVHRGMRRTAS